MTSHENIFKFVITDDDSNEVDRSVDIDFIKECMNCPTVFALLNHSSGSKSFLKYLKRTNTTYFNMFKFILYCKKLNNLIESDYRNGLQYIYKTFIEKRLFPISDRIRRGISWEVKYSIEPMNTFNALYVKVVNALDKEMYSSFLTYQLRNLEILSRASASKNERNCKRHTLETYSSETQECNCKSTCRSSKNNMTPEPKWLAKKLEELKNKSEKHEKSKESEKSKKINFRKLHDILQDVIVFRSDDAENILDEHINSIRPDRDDSELQNDEEESNDAFRSYFLSLNIPSEMFLNLSYLTTTKPKEKDKISPDSGFDTGSVYSSHTCVYSNLENRINKSIADIRTSLEERNEDFTSHDTASNRCNEFRYGAPDAMASRRASLIMNSSSHNHYKERPAPYRPSFSNDSYAHVEEKRIRDLKDEIRRKMRSPSWMGTDLKCGENKTEISNESDLYTIALCHFSDETIPYRMKIQGSSITLGQLKETMPKQGNYRYFFITPCEELSSNVQEEITEDDRILPMWEGRIDARIFAAA